MTHVGTRALEDVLKYGKALLKHLSPNDVGQTRSHQAGYYLPKGAWKLYTSIQPINGINDEETIKVLWQDGNTTECHVKWYGAAKSEYRLTNFGKDFIWRTDDCVGDLLVLIQTSQGEFLAYVLDLDDDIEDIKASLGIEVKQGWEVFDKSAVPSPESGEECVDREFRKAISDMDNFPTGDEVSSIVHKTVDQCFDDFVDKNLDEQLLLLLDEEYSLFKMIERKVCGPAVSRLFESVDDFVNTAMSIVNRRKTRAGRALENHLEFLMRGTGLEFEMRPRIDGNPDILIPGKQAYADDTFPDSKLMMAGVKTTCKDRWRQVLKEAERINTKHLITIQPGMSQSQVSKIKKAGVVLVVPEPLHKLYPSTTDTRPLTVTQFIDKACALGN